MYQLILKDILLQKKRLIFFPLMYTIFIILVLQQLSHSFVIAGSVITYMLLQTAVVYEDMNNSEVIVNSLPIDKEKIVLARYLSVFVYLAISIAGYLLIMGVTNILQLPFNVDPLNVTSLIFALLVISFIISSYLPVYFKCGYVKSKIFHIGFMMGAFFIPTLVASFIRTNPDNFIVKMILKFHFSGVGANIFLSLMALVIMVISYYISVKLYSTREF